MRRVGVLMPFAEDDSDAQANIAAFQQMLQMLGWTDSRNVRIDYRWGGGETERIRAYASELSNLPETVPLFAYRLNYLASNSNAACVSCSGSLPSCR